jgi:hypothetical protein
MLLTLPFVGTPPARRTLVARRIITTDDSRAQLPSPTLKDHFEASRYTTIIKGACPAWHMKKKIQWLLQLSHAFAIYYTCLFNSASSMYEVTKHPFGGMGHVFGPFLFEPCPERTTWWRYPLYHWIGVVQHISTGWIREGKKKVDMGYFMVMRGKKLSFLLCFNLLWEAIFGGYGKKKIKTKQKPPDARGKGNGGSSLVTRQG